jgi:hypothetical protein
VLLRIRFPNESVRQQSLLAADLEASIVREVDSTRIIKEREDTQDPGTILTIVLGAPAVVGAVTAIGAWLVRKNQSSATIEDDQGRVIFKNMRSEDVAAAIRAINPQSTKSG